MTQVLGRIYELVITNATEQFVVVEEGGDLPVGVTTFTPPNTRTIPTDDKLQSRIWKGGSEGLRLQASIDKNNTNSNTNNATIKLYNISKEDLAFITTAAKNRYVSLRAGYKSIVDNALEDEFDALPEVFSGDIVNITSQRQGSDLVTTITAKDSAASIRNVKISRTFPKGSNKKDVVKQLVNSWTGIIFTNTSISDDAKFKSPTFTSSFTASGTVSQVLTQLIKDEDLVWHITNRKFHLIGKTEPKLTRQVNLQPINVINEVTSVQNSNLNAKNPQGLQLRTFLDGAIDTDTSINLQGFDDVNGRGVDGDYNVRTFKHALDTRGNNWFTELVIEAR